MRARDVLRGITPPYLATAARRMRSQVRHRATGWEYVGTTWVDGDGNGWSAETVVDQYVGKLAEFRTAIAAPGCIGVPTEALLGCTPTQYDQNVVLGYAYAVARAAADRRQISILDWGGGFGFMALVTRELFPDLEIDFHVKEIPSIARAARKHVDGVTFWEDDACFARRYDLVSACSSLQYSPDWRGMLLHLGSAARFLVLTRTPVATTPMSFVVRQHAYGTSYVGWVFSRAELLAVAHEAGLSLERELLEGWSPDVPGAPARAEARGYLFSRTRTSDRHDEPPA